MHWIHLIHKFHNLSWITEINLLFHDHDIVYIYIYIYIQTAIFAVYIYICSAKRALAVRFFTFTFSTVNWRCTLMVQKKNCKMTFMWNDIEIKCICQVLSSVKSRWRRLMGHYRKLMIFTILGTSWLVHQPWFVQAKFLPRETNKVNLTYCCIHSQWACCF